MIERYRSDYEGEFVIVETKWAKGKKEQIREWVANPIVNQHISGRAVCITGKLTGHMENFDCSKFKKHRGGLLSSKKLQTYGIGTVTQTAELDFALELNPTELVEIIDRKYQEKHIVYTTAKQCINFPGEFYLIPYNPVLSAEALLLYLAAFDGHQEIFMLGYNRDTPAGNSAWVQHVTTVIQTYYRVKFYMIGHETSMPNEWIDQSNTSCLTIQEFISYCDI